MSCKDHNCPTVKLLNRTNSPNTLYSSKYEELTNACYVLCAFTKMNPSRDIIGLQHSKREIRTFA